MDKKTTLFGNRRNRSNTFQAGSPLFLLFAFALLIGAGSAWAQDPCAKTYNTCSGGSVVLTHDASCGNGGHYVWAAFEDDGNHFFNGVHNGPTYTISGFGLGNIGSGWGDGENPAAANNGNENRCHYPGTMTIDMKDGYNDPQIIFPISLTDGADPSIYKYFVIRYKINEMPSGLTQAQRTMEIFFCSTATPTWDPAKKFSVSIPETSSWGSSEKCSTSNFTTVVIDASTNSSWTTDGNITYFRLDPINYSSTTDNQIHMSIDYIGLVSTPPAAPGVYSKNNSISFGGGNTLTLNNVTDVTTAHSYQINNNYSVDVTQEANSSTPMHNAAGKIYYGWTSTRSTHTVHVYAALNAGKITPASTSVCQGAASDMDYTIGEATAASQAESDVVLSYQWYVSTNGGTREAISGATGNTFQVIAADYSDPGEYVFTRDVISNLCTSSPKTSEGSYTRTVKAKPTMTVSNQTFYTNDGVKTVEFTSTPAGATFAWTNDNTAIGLAATGTGNISFTPTNSTTSDLVANIAVTPTLDGCPGDEQNFTITVKNSVTMNDITDYMHDACSGTDVIAAFTSEIEGVSYNWSHTNTNVTPASGSVGTTGAFSQAFTNSTNAAQTVTFSVTPTKGGINGPAKTFEVTIYPLPVVSITGESTVCPKSTPTFTGTVTTTTTGDYTYTWDGGGDGFLISPISITQSATTHTPSVEAPNNCNQTFTVTLYLEDGNGCEATATKTVAVKDVTAPTIADFTVPAATAAGNCQYAIPDLESAVIAATTDDCGGTITWVSQSPAAGTKYNQTDAVQNITVTVNVKDACNNPQTKTVTVTIPANNLSVGVITTPAAICLEGTAQLTSNIAGAAEGTMTYAWSTTSAGAGMPSVTNTGGITVTPTTVGSKTYTIQVTDGNGCSKTANGSLTVNPLPTISATNATQNITYGQPIVPVVITTNAESDLSLSPLPLWMSYESSTHTLSGTPSAQGTYTVTATATSTSTPNCGTATQVITINVGKKSLTVTYTGTEGANTKVYDGTPLTLSYDKLTFAGLEPGDAFTAGVITTDGYKVGTYVCNAGSFERMMADGVALPSGFAPASVTQNYDVTFNVILTITSRPLEITANSASKPYDATPLTDAGWTYTNGTSLASTDEATVAVTGTQTCPGTSTNVVGAVSIKHVSDNEDVTACYTITKKPGTLTVTPMVCPTTLDYKGYTYPIVQVGNQCWFAENLRAAATGAVPYNEESGNEAKFGLLYNWSAALAEYSTMATDPCNGDFVRGNCPDGWAIPSAADFNELQAFAHGTTALRSDNAAYWLPEYVGTNATNYDERGGGLFNANTNRFEELRSAAYFWTSESVLHAASFPDGVAHTYCDEYYCGEFIPKTISVNSKASIRCIRKTAPGILPPPSTCPSLGATLLKIDDPEANGYGQLSDGIITISTPIVNYDASLITEGWYKITIGTDAPIEFPGTVSANGLVATLQFNDISEDIDLKRINDAIEDDKTVTITPVLKVTCTDPSGVEIEGAGKTIDATCPDYFYYGVSYPAPDYIVVAAEVNNYNATAIDANQIAWTVTSDISSQAPYTFVSGDNNTDTDPGPDHIADIVDDHTQEGMISMDIINAQFPGATKYTFVPSMVVTCNSTTKTLTGPAMTFSLPDFSECPIFASASTLELNGGQYTVDIPYTGTDAFSVNGFYALSRNYSDKYGISAIWYTINAAEKKLQFHVPVDADSYISSLASGETFRMVIDISYGPCPRKSIMLEYTKP